MGEIFRARISNIDVTIQCGVSQVALLERPLVEMRLSPVFHSSTGLRRSMKVPLNY